MKLKNLVPKNLKGSRWEDFFQAIDNYFVDFKTYKIGILKNKFVIDNNSSKENLRDLVKQKGYSIIELNGFTSTLEFLQRRANNVPLEILWLLSQTCYRYILKSFWYYGNIYGLVQDPDGYYYIDDVSRTVSSVSRQVQLLDQEQDIVFYYLEGNPVPNPPLKTFLPALFLDDDLSPYLDMDDIRDGTNHFLIEYSFYKSESLGIFVSENNSRALYETVRQVHRLKETPHYRIKLDFTVNTNGSINKLDFKSYDNKEENISSIETIYLGSNFNLVSSVQIGKSYHPMLNNTITECKIPIGDIPLQEVFLINSQSASGIDVEYKIKEYKKFEIPSGEVIYTFSEITFLDEDENPIAYVKLPEINWYSKMYTGIRLVVTCQDV